MHMIFMRLCLTIQKFGDENGGRLQRTKEGKIVKGGRERGWRDEKELRKKQRKHVQSITIYGQLWNLGVLHFDDSSPLNLNIRPFICIYNSFILSSLFYLWNTRKYLLAIKRGKNRKKVLLNFSNTTRLHGKYSLRPK